jgi:hypothetical protein
MQFPGTYTFNIVLKAGGAPPQELLAEIAALIGRWVVCTNCWGGGQGPPQCLHPLATLENGLPLAASLQSSLMLAGRCIGGVIRLSAADEAGNQPKTHPGAYKAMLSLCPCHQPPVHSALPAAA